MEKKSKVIILILVILIICGLATQIFLTPSTIETNGSKNITDMANRSVQIPAKINHIVATSPSITTVIYMLAPEKLAAVNFQWTDKEMEYVPSQYQNLPVVGGWFGSKDGSYEEFIASEPDMVVEFIDEGVSADLSTVQERQNKFGSIPVVAVFDTNNVTKVSNSIEFIGMLLGAEDKAQKLIDFNNKYLNKVKQVDSTIPDSDRKTVYYAEGNDGLQTDLSGSSHSQLINLCGGKNVADSLGDGNGAGSAQVSIEQVIEWNPDIIITTDQDFYDNVYNDPNWDSINAVKNHEVYISPQSPFKWFDRPTGVNVIIGVPWTAKVIYPEQYADLDLSEATEDFYSDFYHVDLSDDQVKDILIGSGLKKSNI